MKGVEKKEDDEGVSSLLWDDTACGTRTASRGRRLLQARDTRRGQLARLKPHEGLKPVAVMHSQLRNVRHR